MRLAGQCGGDESVVRLAPGCDPARLRLSPAEGFLLSRIDGHTPRGVLRRIGALDPAEIDRCLERWLAAGVLELVRPGAPPPKAAAQAAPAPPPAPPAAARAPAASARAVPAIDESLEIEVELQRELLVFAARLERPYHEILGVARDADERAIKRAYFALAKRLHPDRYFRRRVGAFAPLIQTCFKKLLEAYELLSDPNTRAEVQDAPPPPAAGGGEPARRSSLEARRRLRERVGALAGAKRASEERRRKAKGFFEAGMAAFAAERWLEAASAVRLAIAFDPENEAFRERFSEVQQRAHHERSRALERQAESALGLHDYAEAFRLLEEAVHFRPADPELAHRAAKIAWQALGELRKAKELAAHAVELDPGKGAYRRTLGSIYRAAGLVANARRELEAALRIDPRDAEAKAALRGI
jgi:curved DNA-binding protein CbpA